MDLVSVTISAYNHERYIEECIRSIIAQTYENIELLVIDDGSTDKTFEILQSLKPECEKRFAKVSFETHTNRGMPETSNILIEKARGVYIYGIASDDKAKPYAIERLHDFLSRNPDYVLAVGDNEMIDRDSNRIYWDNKRNVVSAENAVCRTVGEDLGINNTDKFGRYETLLRANHVPNGYLIRRQAMIDCGKYNPDILLEDWYMNLQLIKIGKLKYIPEILFSYRWHDSNTIKSEAIEKKRKEIYRQIYLHEKSYCFSNGYKKLWKKMWSKQFGLRAMWKRLRDFIRRKK